MSDYHWFIGSDVGGLLYMGIPYLMIWLEIGHAILSLIDDEQDVQLMTKSEFINSIA